MEGDGLRGYDGAMVTRYDDMLETAVAIELECAALYEVFAKTFSAYPDQVYFWRLYAEAERYHAASIRIHQLRLNAEPVAEDTQELVGLEDAKAFLGEVRSRRERYEKGPVTIGEALAAARWTEEQSAELHGRTQFFKNIPEFGELFEKMVEEDRAHRDVLASAEAKWGRRK